MFFAMSSDHGSVIAGKKKPRNKDGTLYRITKKYYSNKGSPDFHQMVVFLEGMYATIYIVPLMWLCVLPKVRIVCVCILSADGLALSLHLVVVG